MKIKGYIIRKQYKIKKTLKNFFIDINEIL